MGMNFQMSMEFISTSLKKWLPRMNDFQRQNVSASIYDSLDTMRKAGKTENMLKNAYIKFLCWLYYKFERIVNQLGENNIPKILYEGNVSNYELMLISILSNAGCDVVMLQYQGDLGYLKVDPNSVLSDNHWQAEDSRSPPHCHPTGNKRSARQKLQSSPVPAADPPSSPSHLQMPSGSICSQAHWSLWMPSMDIIYVHPDNS